VTWSSSNTSIATVNSSGVVTGVSQGTAVITASAAGGSITDSCTVTVRNIIVSGDPRQEYYENRYPGKIVVILPDENSYAQATGDTVIVGGNGDDYVEILNGGNIFVYNRNGGHDTIVCLDVQSGDRNKIHFGPGIWKEDLVFSRQDDDMVITILDETGNGSGSVTVTDWYLEAKNRMRIVLFDGTVLKISEIEESVNNKPVIMYGTEGNDVLRSASKIGSTYILYGLGGNDVIYSRNGTDVFVPGPGTNTIYARAHISAEGGGKKTFVHNVGDGHHTIYYDNSARKVGDGLAVLRFGANISLENVTVHNSGVDVVFVVTPEDGNAGSITFISANRGVIRYQMDEIQFADGTVYKWATKPWELSV
jgi:Ca2+-binding RTX toxin-like protein